MRSGFVVRVVIRAFRGAEAGTWTTKRTKKNTKFTKQDAVSEGACF